MFTPPSPPPRTPSSLSITATQERGELAGVRTKTGLSEHVSMLCVGSCIHHSVQNRAVCDGMLRYQNQCGEGRDGW